MDGVARRFGLFEILRIDEQRRLGLKRAIGALHLNALFLEIDERFDHFGRHLNLLRFLVLIFRRFFGAIVPSLLCAQPRSAALRFLRCTSHLVGAGQIVLCGVGGICRGLVFCGDLVGAC